MASGSIQISATIITHNEERSIGRCIESLQGVADEIIVVDSFSTDRTKSICESAGVIFLENPFETFSRQKNFASSQTRHPWVLSLDADEVLSPPLQDSIRRIKDAADHKAYSFNRLTNYCGKWIRHSGWYPDRKIRLWHKDYGNWNGQSPHESVRLEAGTRVKFLRGDLLHYSYYSIREHVERMNKYSDMAALDKFQNGKSSSLGKSIGKAAFKFFRNYFLKLGFLDGYYGFIVCLISSHETFLKYIKLNELSKSKITTHDGIANHEAIGGNGE